MSTEAILLSCVFVLAILVVGYLFTAYEFKFMSDHPEQFGETEDPDRIHIVEEQ